jgi:hypothetical protein
MLYKQELKNNKMNFENDALILKKAVGKDIEIFIKVFCNLNEKYPDKKELIIDIVEKELEERGKKADAFIKKATKIVFPNKVAELESLTC